MKHINLLTITDGYDYAPIIDHLRECADGHPGLPVGDSCLSYPIDMLAEMHDDWHKSAKPYFGERNVLRND